MPIHDKYAHWRNLLSRNKIPQVLEELRQVFAQSPRLGEIVHQQGRHAALSEGIRTGKINLEEENVLNNQLLAGVIALLDDMEKWEGEDAGLARELAPVTIEITGSVSKAVINSTINAEKVHIGDVVHYHGETIRHFLTAQPQNPPVFKGRAEQLKELHEKLFHGTGDHVLLLVNGQGGVGKTSLANRYFFDYHDRYHHAAWVLKDGSIRDALLSLEPGLNLRFATETSEQRLRIILQKVANLKAPCLLIIDNANERDDLVQHIGALRQCANFHVLLTSRLDYFDGAKTYKVGALPLSVAKELFEQYYRPFNAEEAALFPDVYTAVDGNTLVLQLLAKNLKKNRRQYFLPDLLADLQSKGVLQLSSSKKVVTDYGNLNEGQIEDIVAAMYELGALGGQQLQLLSVFAALPPEKIPYTHLEVLVTFLDDLDETLDELQQLGWLEENEDGGRSSYRCSPVVQAVVRQKKEDWKAVLPLLRSNIEEYLETDQSGNIKVGIKVARPFVLYGEAIKPYLPQVYANSYFLQQLAYFYTSSGDLRSAYKSSEERSTLLEALLTEDPDNSDIKNALAISYAMLGETHSSMGNLPKALEFFEQRSKIGQELHAAYPDNVGFKNGLATSYSKLGETHSSMGNLPKALEFFETETELFEELHAAYPDNVGFKNGLAISYEKLGKTHSSMGNLPKALEFFETETELFEELHAAYPDNVGFKNGLAISYSKLGETHSSMGNLPKALEFFETQTELFEELHAAYPDNVGFKNGLAISYSKLGETHSSMGNLPKALEFFEQRSKIGQELHAAYPDNVGFKNGLAISYLKLGQTHSSLGSLNKALEYFEIQTTLFEELLAAYPDQVGFKNGLATSYIWLADVVDTDNKKKELYLQAEQLWVELTDSFPDYAQFKSNLKWVQGQLSAL